MEDLSSQLSILRAKLEDPTSELNELKELNKKLMAQLDEARGSNRQRTKSFIDHRVLFAGHILEERRN